ncbi:nucleotidyltransferase family protein [Frigoribacterium sp. CFBP 8759]|uniref:nucleotidyltransferase family protein n=1 Tax=Frigoribacterium sp. CFBP 8759 TaxID=2775283 RepID=UPI00177F4946|nr:nucleotidyltransferase family protein [Frigoribacterium sp. CFBP 8759]MBD8484676.1 nucleotidyltransferase family protein [Frigoribacterium sp. CFBP 8759]
MPGDDSSTSVGLLLAAGAGTRMGRPKALVVDERGPWLTRAVTTLLDGGCDRVVVVLGAGATEARALLAADPRLLTVETPVPVGATDAPHADPRLPPVDGRARVAVVVADDWADGLAASLRVGLAALAASDPEEARLALITLVDYPGLPPSAVARLLSSSAADVPLGPAALRQSVFHGRPGHPVVVGRSHWSALAASLTGDRGAGPYLRAHTAEPVDCSDLWDGADVDAPA